MNQPSEKELLQALRDRFAEIIKAERNRVNEEKALLKGVLRSSGFGGRTNHYTNVAFSNIYLIDELDKFRLS